MCGVKVPKIMEVILLVGNFDRAMGGGGGGAVVFFGKKSKWGQI